MPTNDSNLAAPAVPAPVKKTAAAPAPAKFVPLTRTKDTTATSPGPHQPTAHPIDEKVDVKPWSAPAPKAAAPSATPSTPKSN